MYIFLRYLKFKAFKVALKLQLYILLRPTESRNACNAWCARWLRNVAVHWLLGVAPLLLGRRLLLPSEPALQTDYR